MGERLIPWLVEMMIPCLAKMSMRPVHMLGHWVAEWSSALAVATATTIAAESRKQHSKQTGSELLKMCALCLGLCVAMGLLSAALCFLNIKKHIGSLAFWGQIWGQICPQIWGFPKFVPKFWDIFVPKFGDSPNLSPNSRTNSSPNFMNPRICPQV